jgi:hypothetical protein
MACKSKPEQAAQSNDPVEDKRTLLLEFHPDRDGQRKQITVFKFQRGLSPERLA